MNILKSGKRYLVIFTALVMSFSFSLGSMNESHASTYSKDLYGEATHLCYTPEHGLTTFWADYHYSEGYERLADGRSNFNNRHSFVSITSSRYDWDTPYSLGVYAIKHYNGSGTVLKTFSMTSPTHSIYIDPSDFEYYHKDNATSVVYSRNTTNYGCVKYYIRGTDSLVYATKEYTLSLMI